jgi:hypothetical protein
MQYPRDPNEVPPQPDVPLPEDTTVTPEHVHPPEDGWPGAVLVVLGVVLIMALGFMYLAPPASGPSDLPTTTTSSERATDPNSTLKQSGN